jgi:hypothetical protein
MYHPYLFRWFQISRTVYRSVIYHLHTHAHRHKCRDHNLRTNSSISTIPLSPNLYWWLYLSTLMIFRKVNRRLVIVLLERFISVIILSLSAILYKCMKINLNNNLLCSVKREWDICLIDDHFPIQSRPAIYCILRVSCYLHTYMDTC